MERTNTLKSPRKPHSEALNLLRFPLALVVVLVHVFGASIPGREQFIETSFLYKETMNFVRAFLASQSVPIYFFISGYVFFWGITLTKEKYKQKLQNRKKTLLIPYVIWNLLMLALYFLLRMPAFASLSPSLQQMEPNFTLSGFLNCFWDANYSVFPLNEHPGSSNIYPINGPLWFLRDLMIVVLTTPAIYWVLKKTGFYVLIFLGILKLFVTPYVDWGYCAGQLLTAYFYFSWGAYMSINNKNMIVEFGRFTRISTILYIFLGVAHMIAAHYYPAATSNIKSINIIVGLFFAYNFAAWLLRHHICKSNEFLSSVSFFIYISHRLVWVILLKVMLMVIKPSSGIAGLMVHFMTWATTIILLCIAFWLMRRYLPGLLKVVAGRK